MNHFKAIVVILLWLGSLAVVSMVTTHVNSRIAQKKNDVPTAMELVDLGSGWEYVTARKYSDGGTWDLGFQETNGYFIFVRIDYNLGMDHNYRKFYLGNNIVPGRGDFVEIERGTELERKVIDIIANSRDCNSNVCKKLPDKSTVVSLLKSRDIKINLDVE